MSLTSTINAKFDQRANSLLLLLQMYQISMTQAGQSWTIYRRYKQFRELDSNVRFGL